jgi:hypothetical protein
MVCSVRRTPCAPGWNIVHGNLPPVGSSISTGLSVRVSLRCAGIQAKADMTALTERGDRDRRPQCLFVARVYAEGHSDGEPGWWSVGPEFLFWHMFGIAFRTKQTLSDPLFHSCGAFISTSLAHPPHPTHLQHTRSAFSQYASTPPLYSPHRVSHVKLTDECFRFLEETAERDRASGARLPPNPHRTVGGVKKECYSRCLCVLLMLKVRRNTHFGNKAVRGVLKETKVSDGCFSAAAYAKRE